MHNGKFWDFLIWTCVIITIVIILIQAIGGTWLKIRFVSEFFATESIPEWLKWVVVCK